MPYGWALWLRALPAMPAKPHARARDVAALLAERPGTPIPPGRELATWPAFFSLFHQGWQPPPRDERLAGRKLERVRNAEQEREDDDVPILHDARERQERHRERVDHAQALADENDLPEVVPLHERPGERPEDEDRELPREVDDPQAERGSREAVDEPAHGDPLQGAKSLQA